VPLENPIIFDLCSPLLDNSYIIRPYTINGQEKPSPGLNSVRPLTAGSDHWFSLTPTGSTIKKEHCLSTTLLSHTSHESLKLLYYSWTVISPGDRFPSLIYCELARIILGLFDSLYRVWSREVARLLLLASTRIFERPTQYYPLACVLCIKEPATPSFWRFKISQASISRHFGAYCPKVALFEHDSAGWK